MARMGYGKVLIIVVLLALSGTAGAQQYRSKLLLNPGRALSESAAASIDELEARFADIEQDYARASAGSQLARHHVQQGNYEKAIAYYQSALSAQGLAPIVQADLRRELAEVYLHTRQPAQSLEALQALGSWETFSDPDVLLTYGRAQSMLGNYLAVADCLDRLLQLASPEQQGLYQRMVVLAYGIQDYQRSAAILEGLLEHYPGQADYWFQLVSVLLKLGQHLSALDYLLMAQWQGITFSQQNILLLAGLHATQGNPYAGAKVLEQALDTGVVAESGDHYRLLFEYWLQARERERALAALARAARLSGDAELFLYWAQQLMEQARWGEMNGVIRELCQAGIGPRYVGRANLMLGISEYGLGKKAAAYRAFANATLSGGVNTQAGHWLTKLESEGVQGRVAASVSGPCQAAVP